MSDLSQVFHYKIRSAAKITQLNYFTSHSFYIYIFSELRSPDKYLVGGEFGEEGGERAKWAGPENGKNANLSVLR